MYIICLTKWASFSITPHFYGLFIVLHNDFASLLLSMFGTCFHGRQLIQGFCLDYGQCAWYICMYVITVSFVRIVLIFFFQPSQLVSAEPHPLPPAPSLPLPPCPQPPHSPPSTTSTPTPRPHPHHPMLPSTYKWVPNCMALKRPPTAKASEVLGAGGHPCVSLVHHLLSWVYVWSAVVCVCLPMQKDIEITRRAQVSEASSEFQETQLTPIHKG